MESRVPDQRIVTVADEPVSSDGRYVVYWMIAQRRTAWNFGLERAVEWSRNLGLPLVVFEPLRCDYRWASDRIHSFVLDGMVDNAETLKHRPVTYLPWIERQPGEGRGLLQALAGDAAVVVSDHFPCFFLPRIVQAAAAFSPVRLEAVDSCGLVPLRATECAFARAYDFRRFLQRELLTHLESMPLEDPLAGADLPLLEALPDSITPRSRPARDLLAPERDLSSLPIDHAVEPVAERGGRRAASLRLHRFLDEGLDRYHETRRDAAADSGSRLSGHLHFGHADPWSALTAIAEREGWTPASVGKSRSGARSGWWNLSAGAEAFLDQLVTWRELGYQFTEHRPDYDRFESLPGWATETLGEHSDDRRPYVYTLAELEAAATHDEIWNAAQNQLRGEGRIHNYLRMLWGKKILHWSESPRQALEVMIELNNKYAIDGRDPNSYSGIFWTLGRFDRAWGPEREVFGKVRYMSSDSTRRKLRLDAYLSRWGR